MAQHKNLKSKEMNNYCKDCKFFNDLKYRCIQKKWGFKGKQVDPKDSSCEDFISIEKECCGGAGDCGEDCCGQGACSPRTDEKNDYRGSQSGPPSYEEIWDTLYGKDED